jgi:Tol biopolymer transport system component
VLFEAPSRYQADFEEEMGAVFWPFNQPRRSVESSRAYARQGNLVIHDVSTRKQKLALSQNNRRYRYIEHNFGWSPDSKRIVFKGHQPNGTIDVGIVSLTGEEPELKIRLDGKEVQSDFSWHPAGRLMFPHLPPGGGLTQIYEIDPDGDQPQSVIRDSQRADTTADSAGRATARHSYS